MSSVAAAGAGIYPDIQSAADKMVQVSGVIEPNSEKHKEYQLFYENYKQTYQTVSILRKNLEKQGN